MQFESCGFYYGETGAAASADSKRHEQKMDIGSVEEVFLTLADNFSCSNWQVEKMPSGYEATHSMQAVRVEYKNGRGQRLNAVGAWTP